MKPSMESLKGLPPEAVEATIEHWTKMGKLEQLAGVIGLESLKKEADRQHRTRTAEEEKVCQLLGWKNPSQSADSCLGEEPDMGNIVLGNVTNPPPVVIQQPAPQQPVPAPIVKKGIGTAAAIALGALGPGGVLAGMAINHFMDDTPEPTPVVDKDSTVELRLKKLSDLDLTP